MPCVHMIFAHGALIYDVIRAHACLQTRRKVHRTYLGGGLTRVAREMRQRAVNEAVGHATAGYRLLADARDHLRVARG